MQINLKHLDLKQRPVRLLLMLVFAGALTASMASMVGAQPPQRDPDGLPQIPPAGVGRIGARVGARVERLRLTLPVDPTVVVVPNGDAYIDAIAGWSTQRRYPVLINDGTPGARENIARFIKAFEPERILLWPGAGERDGSIRERMESAFHRAWGADSFEAMQEIWIENKLRPPGVVVASEGDSAWPAALALAAGRGQPIFWVDGGLRGIGNVCKAKDFQRFDKQVQAQFRGLGYRWARLDDDIDAITVCMNMPSRVYSAKSEKDIWALTDRIGRFEDGRLYAWAGIIIGTEAESAYRAMSALFLLPQNYWLFNGYGTQQPYDAFGLYPVEGLLRRLGLPARSFITPRNSIKDWRAATRAPIDAGYVHVNSSGHRGWFDLNPGQAYTADIPFLQTPALVTFVHSFSAQKLSDRDSIARRWLDNGAYAYVGAVDEPYLQGFNPPANIVPGLFAPVPLSATVRPITGKPWKISTIGDPLITFGPPAKRTTTTGALPRSLPGAVTMEDAMKSALKGNDYANGLTRLVMLGRHGDAADLGEAIITQDPDALTPEVAEILLWVFYRAQSPDMLIRCHRAMSPQDRNDTLVVDVLWKALGKELVTTSNADILDTLLVNIRDGKDSKFAEDITVVSNALKRLRGDAAALAFLTRIERAEENDLSKAHRRALRRQLGRFNAGNTTNRNRGGNRNRDR